MQRASRPAPERPRGRWDGLVGIEDTIEASVDDTASTTYRLSIQAQGGVANAEGRRSFGVTGSVRCSSRRGRRARPLRATVSVRS